jgi:phenylpropionate dioxygenase-like ring-hydroxylating dioxygenase large terminal subunit
MIMAPVGWFQVAFLPELRTPATPIVPLQVGDRRLMAIVAGPQVRIYDAACPHRGASLAHGGRLEGDTVICPFHGHAVALGNDSTTPFQARRHPVCIVGDLVFAHLGPSEPLDLPAYLSELVAGHRIVPGFTMSATVPHALVIENAFDGAHFAPVHHARAAAVDAHEATDGRFVGKTVLTIPPSQWQRSTDADRLVRVPLDMSAFGAGVVVSSVGGPHPYTVVTAATPQADGVTTIRLSLAFPKAAGHAAAEMDRYMIQQSQRGLELDCAIWSTLDLKATPQFVESDKAVVAFRAYCRAFLAGEAR